MLQELTKTKSISVQDSRHLIFEPDSDCKKLLIVFSYINQKLGTRLHSSFLRNVNCKKIFLNPGLNEWYQTGVPGVASSYSDLLAFLQDVKSNLKDTQIECGDLTPTLFSNSKSSITVLVGKQNAFDMTVARRLSEFPRTDVIALETGHNTFPYLKDVGRLGETLEAFVDARDIRSVAAGV
jgi:hypothetical protein